MDEIKSAFQIAMERAERLGRASAEEQQRWRLEPEGERLAAAHLQEEANLVPALTRYAPDERPHVVAGAQKVFLHSLDLPRNELVKRRNRRAMEALKAIKEDKVAVENVFTKMRRLFEHYETQGEQQRQQAYRDLREDFTAQLQRAMAQQGARPAFGYSLQPENHPQFQEEWSRVLAQLNTQYLKVLEEYRVELTAIQ
jgi:hypothetical protein